jgi:hypothetical protein
VEVDFHGNLHGHRLAIFLSRVELPVFDCFNRFRVEAMQKRPGLARAFSFEC